jgi:hypothetical protein
MALISVATLLASLLLKLSSSLFASRTSVVLGQRTSALGVVPKFTPMMTGQDKSISCASF